MFATRHFVEFDCPWCGNYQNKQVYSGAETEVLCTQCKKLIGIVTNNAGSPIRIGTKVHVVKPVEMQAEQSNHDKAPSISIGSVYDSVAVGGNATTTSIYE